MADNPLLQVARERIEKFDATHGGPKEREERAERLFRGQGSIEDLRAWGQENEMSLQDVLNFEGLSVAGFQKTGNRTLTLYRIDPSFLPQRVVVRASNR